MTFGERLKELRKKRGLTQKELAQLISAKNNSVSNWENDQNIPTASVVFSLARALNVTVEDLIGHYSMDEVIAIGKNLLTNEPAMKSWSIMFFTNILPILDVG